MTNEINILIINSSFKKNGQTKRLLNYVVSELTSLNEDVLLHKRYIELSDLDIQLCRGCAACFKSGKCSLNDDIEKIKQNLLWADLIIMGAPVYLNHIPGALKVVLDRLASWAHIMPLYGKRGVLVITGSQSGIDESGSYLNEVLSFFGVSIDSIFKVNQSFVDLCTSKTELLCCLKKSLTDLLCEEEKVSYNVMQKYEFFKSYYSNNKNVLRNTYEYKFWNELGRLNQTMKGGDKYGK